tara:strand:- start:334 stop:531 length:198 start_codon:yes stop_codon:yes gene_type:complete
MIFEHDIFTFEVTRDRNNLTIMMIDYTTENGETVLLNDPCDMTYVVSKSVYNEAKDLLAEYEEDN